ADVKYEAVEKQVEPDVYMSFLQYPSQSMFISARSVGDPARLIRKAVADLDADIPVTQVETMSKRVERATSPVRFVAVLLGAFAAIAGFLAAIGIFGVVSYSVSARTREIGIRMALGARASTVLRTVVTDGVLLAGLGVVLGVPLAIWVTRVLSTMLYGVSPGD